MFVAIEIETLAKKYDGVKAESVADIGKMKTSLITEVGHKLTTEIQTAKKELVTLMGTNFRTFPTGLIMSHRSSHG